MSNHNHEKNSSGMIPHARIHTNCFTVDVFGDADTVLRVDYHHPALAPAGTASEVMSPLGERVVAEITRYFDNSGYVMQLPFRLSGTAYQQKVFQCISQIPPGEVMTYGEVARRINSAPRAVGGACRENPLPLLVPCHRVVAQAGLGGFMGSNKRHRLDIKRWLLRHENALPA